MSSVAFGSSFSFITAATPSTGWLVGYDTDGILKQKDSSGIIIPIGGGPTAGNPSTYSISQVLAVGNNTNSYSIILGTSSYIKSANGGGKIQLDYTGTNSVFISTDNSVGNESGLLMRNGSVKFFNNTGSSNYRKAIELENGSNQLSIHNTNSGDILIGVAKGPSVYADLEEIKISYNNTATVSTGNYDKQAVFIGTKNSKISNGVVNTVVIGGESFTASLSNTVYVPNLAIKNGSFLKSTDSNEILYLSDSSGNTVFDRNSGSFDSSWMVFASNYNSKKEWVEFGVNSDPGYGTNSRLTLYNTKGPSYSWATYSSLVLDKDFLKIESLDLDNSGNVISIKLDPQNAKGLVEGPSSFKGLQYKSDYSLNFTTYSLVDKNYVDNSLSNPSLESVLTTGNNSGSKDIVVGTATVIKSANGGGQIDFDFGGSQNRLLISNDNGALTSTYIYLDNNSLQIEAPSQFDLTVNSANINVASSIGLEYTSDYSSTFATNSLISRKYVDLGTQSIWNYIQDVATGSGTTNYLPKWKTSHNLSSTSSIYISDLVLKDTYESKTVGTTPISVEWEGKYKYFYVSNAGDNSVSIINSDTLQTTATVSVGSYPISLAWDSKNNRIYVANQNTDNVSVIDTLTQTVTATIPVGDFPTGIIFDKNNDLIFVSNQLGGSVSVIDTSTNTVTNSIPMTTPRAFAHDFNNGVIWVTGVGLDYVGKIDTNTLSSIGTVSVGTNPFGAAYDSKNGRVWVTNYVSNNVSIINTSTNLIVATVSVDSNPDGISYDSINDKMYVACSGSGTIKVIDTTTYTVTSTISPSGTPREFGFDLSNARMAVSDSSNSLIRIIETITKNDFIGVKTEKPTSEFDVNGKITTNKFRLKDGANSGYYLVSDESGNATWQYPIIQISGGSGLTGSGTAGSVTLSVDYPTLTKNIEGNGLTANSGILSVNVDNGISISSDKVVLGGVLTQNTTIDGDLNSYNLSLTKIKDFELNTTNLIIDLDQQFTINGGLTMSFNVGGLAEITDLVNGWGFVYSDDYSSTFVTHSLVDKNYVDSNTLGKYSTTNSFTASVTQTITHSLGTDEIIVQCYDSSGNMVIPGTVKINGSNSVDITFSATIANIKTIIIG